MEGREERGTKQRERTEREMIQIIRTGEPPGIRYWSLQVLASGGGGGGGVGGGGRRCGGGVG